jgi:hypothetical protein
VQNARQVVPGHRLYHRVHVVWHDAPCVQPIPLFVEELERGGDDFGYCGPTQQAFAADEFDMSGGTREYQVYVAPRP